MALAEGDYVVFLDNDTVVTPGWLSRLIGHCGADRAIGLLGPSTNFISGPQMLPDVEYEDTAELIAIAEEIAVRCAGVLQPTTHLVGFCMLIRRAVIDKIGGCDPRFGRYGFEDDDYCLRAVLAGFDTYIARDVFIHHVGSQGSSDGGQDYRTLVREAWEVFRAKWELPVSVTFEAYVGDRSHYMPDRPFDPTTDYVPAPDRAALAPLITRRVH